MIRRLALALVILLLNMPALAVQDEYAFTTPADAERFQELTQTLRCLVCQNQNLAESNAGLAQDLRQQIYTQIQAGRSNREITDYLLARYGNYILYRPPFTLSTSLLWLGPFIIMVAGISTLIYFIIKKTRI